MWTKTLLIFLIVNYTGEVQLVNWIISGNPEARAYPCKGNDKILVTYESGLPPEEENKYRVYIGEFLPKYSKIYLKFDSEATVKLSDPSVARISADNERFYIHFFKEAPKGIGFDVRGPVNGTVPYITSVLLNTEENCKEPLTGFLDEQIQGYKDKAEISLTVPKNYCGRRQVQHTQLITNGLVTKPGDWPWHVALYRLEKTDIKYICGGTLMSKNFVLTAAHCVTISGAPVLPETLSVVLAKYKLIGGDIEQLEREVHEVIIHEEFSVRHLDHDIALLKLISQVYFNEYIQPACLWYADAYKKLPKGQIFGTVVGWGFDHTDNLSPQLRQASIPKVSESKCIKSNPVFYGNILNENKFCAGLLNGTSACNGDSGGGFHIFVPDSSSNISSNIQGAWYVRGIVSLSMARAGLALCDPNHYVVFTDVAKYRGWVKKYVG